MNTLEELFEELADFLIEGSFQLRWIEIEFHHRIGAFVSDLISKTKNEEVVYTVLRVKTGKNRAFWKLHKEFFEKYPDLDRTNWGKDITWSAIRQALHPQTRKRKRIPEIIQKHVKEYEAKQGEYWRGRLDEAKDLMEVIK